MAEDEEPALGSGEPAAGLGDGAAAGNAAVQEAGMPSSGMKSAADTAAPQAGNSPAAAAGGMQNGTALGASSASGAQPEAISSPTTTAVPATGGTDSGGGGGGSRQSATDQEQQVGAEHEALAAKLNALGGLVAKFGVALPQTDADELREAFNAVAGEADRASSQATGMAVLLNDAVDQAERLAGENKELRRKQEDAVLDKQLKQAQNETEKLKMAGDAYKRELLQQKLSDTEWALAREQDRAKEAESDRAALQIQVKELKMQLKAAGGAPESSLLQVEGSDAPMSAKEREELAVALSAGEGDRRTIDAQVLVRVVKGLRDTAVLEQHLKQTLQEKERLAQMVEELNDIVFSKTFKAPSAWADRERKYKMEARDWDIEVKKLQDRIEKLRAENKRYRETNRTAEFEAAVAALQRQVEAANVAKVAAQQEAHELRLKMRETDGEFTSDGKRSPYKSPFRSTVTEITKIESRQPVPAPSDDAAAGSSPAGGEPLPPVSEVGATIKGMERAGIGTRAPKTFRPGRTRISRGGPPLSSPLTSTASVGSQDWGMDVLPALEQQGVGRMDAAAPQEWTASDVKRPHDGQAPPGSRRFSAPGAGFKTALGEAQRTASLDASPSRSIDAGAEPQRRSSIGGPPDVSAASSLDNSPARWPEGNAPVPAGMHSPAVPSPRDSAAAAEPATSAVPDAAPTSSSGGAPDLAGAPGAAAGTNADAVWTGTAAGVDANAVWSSMGGDSAAAATGVSPSRDFSADAEQSAGISAAERENMYRMYSQHVEAEDVGALKYRAAELSSRLEMMQAQLSKASLAAERADEDKAKLEAELAAALAATTTPPDQTQLGAMQGRLAELSERRGAREEEAAKRLRDAEERLKASNQALQAAHREHQENEKRMRRLEKQLATLSSALGPAAAAALEAAETGSSASAEEGSSPRRDASSPGGSPHPTSGAGAPGTTSGDAATEGAGGTRRGWGWGDVGGLSEETLESVRLREENELLMENLVRSKLEMAETQSDYVKTKRALIRAVEKQAEMSEKMDLLKAELEAMNLGDGGGGGTAPTSTYSGGGGFAGMGNFTSSLRGRLSDALGGSPAKQIEAKSPEVKTPETKPQEAKQPAAGQPEESQ